MAKVNYDDVVAFAARYITVERVDDIARITYAPIPEFGREGFVEEIPWIEGLTAEFVAQVGIADCFRN